MMIWLRLKVIMPGLLLSGCAMAFTMNVLAADSSLPERPWGWDSAAGDCVVCHSLEKNGPFRSAPNLWGIVDAPKASNSAFGYSIALKKKGGDWTEQALDKFFSGPSAFVPGTKKTIAAIKDSDRRKEIIDYLKTLSD